MTFNEYRKLNKQTKGMIFKLYVTYCDNNKINKIISKDWYRWLRENFNEVKDAGVA